MTGDDVQKEQELRDLKKEAVENSEALQKKLAEIVFNDEQSKQYKKEAASEKMKLAQELSELNKANEELEVENQRLIKLQDGAQSKMKKIVEVQERRKGELTPIDMFQSIPTSVEFQRGDGTFGSYKSETKEELEMEANLRKQEKEAVFQRKEQKRKRTLGVEAASKRRKSDVGYAEEYRNIEKNHRTLKYTDPIPE